ncbi:protein kinase domain-containing protein [Aureliella helgolandensis]|uniref:Serine/threonine-protein kinase PknB n=1 Tax=Aureliella helgolandensis TaxID=2527968 RepID=A0A518G0Q5_9BACT|nr:Hsp70 family protein [Aureliella helgolandensis]QDV22187.1 Serine/threonine-protein kinase PknB [Aureliella helgolandensis]
MSFTADNNSQSGSSLPDDATRFDVRGEASGIDSGEFELQPLDLPTQAGPLGVLGEYLLLEPIGAGGMGSVYRAEHRTMNRHVALKILSPEISGRQDLLEQFFAEIRAVARLMHPGIVTAFDAGSVQGKHFLVMELVDGQILSDRLRAEGPFTTVAAANVLEQAASALEYAHRMGIVHRDIKPSNMMLSKDGRLKILDFGLAMFSKGVVARSNKCVFMGTPEYMSPEQIENPDRVDGRSDLYSLGATLFYLLTGKSMFRGDKMQVATAQLRQKPPPLYTVRADVDLRLDAIFQRLTAKLPEERYSSAGELLASLKTLNLVAQSDGKQVVFPKGALRLQGDNPTSVAINKSTLARKSQIVAIDLGTLVSTAAYIDPQLGPQIISQGEGNAQHLRNMLWSDGTQIKIGGPALSARQASPEMIFHSVQRWIGAPRLTWNMAGCQPPPEVALAAILRQIMWNSAAATDSGTSAIVTVPGCYDQLHRRSVRDACRIAGIDLVQLLNKPLAATSYWFDLNARLLSGKSSAGHESLDSKIDAKVLVVHLGGSAMEASVIHATQESLKQLSCHGSWKQGSLRWQALLTEYFVGALQEQTGKSVRQDVPAATRLQRTIELAIDRLTSAAKVEIRFEWSGASITQVVTQDGLVRIAPELVESLRQTVRAACAEAQLATSDIQHLLLTGSMMRMQAIRQIVRELLPKGVRVSLIEKADMARGAAIEAQQLGNLGQKSSEQPQGQACLAYPLAILASSGGSLKPRVLLPRGTALPASFSRSLKPGIAKDGSVALPAVQLIEGTNLGDANWLKLGMAEPSSVFTERRPDDPLRLQLEVDESGLLCSSLVWPSGNRQVRLPPSSDATLTDAEIDHWRRWLETAMMC